MTERAIQAAVARADLWITAAARIGAAVGLGAGLLGLVCLIIWIWRRGHG